MSNALFRRLSVVAVVVAAVISPCSAIAQVNAHWAAPTTGGWSVPANWDVPPNYPNNGNGGFTYNAFIDMAGSPYTVTLSEGIHIVNFQMMSVDATLNLANFGLTLDGTYLQQGSRLSTAGSGTVQAAGAATLRDATLQGVTDFTAQNPLTFDGSTLTTINASTINHTGTGASWSGTGNIQFGGSTVLNHNNAASTFTISNDQTLSWDNSGTRPIFNNAGTLRKTAGAGVTSFTGVTLNNTGTLRVDSGTFRADNVGNITAGTLPAGSTWQVTGTGNLDLVGVNILTNRGTVILSGANSAFGAINSLQTNAGTGQFLIQGGRTFTAAPGTFTNNGVISITPGSVFQTGAGTTLNTVGGVINGNGGGLLRTAGPLSVQGSTFQGLGVQTTGNLQFTGNTSSDMCDTDIDHSGPSCVWDGTGGIVMGGANSVQRHFTNGAPSTFMINNDQSLRWDNSGVRPVFNNLGTVQKNSTTGVTFIDGVKLNNTGTIAVSTGTLMSNSVQNVVANTLTGGTWNVNAGATLDLAGQTISTNAANVTLSGVGSTFSALTANIQTNAAGGQLTFKDGRNFTTPANFTNNGLLKITAQAAPTTFRVAPGSALTNYNPLTRTLTGGRFMVEGAGRVDGRIEFDGADIATLDAGIILMGAGAGIFDPAAGGASALINLGLIDNAGSFEIAQGHNFDTVGNFTVAPSGALAISDTTIFNVAPGSIMTNFDHNAIPGLFEDGNFHVQGTLIADNANVTMLNNTIALDGPGAHIQNRTGDNAFSALNHILASGHLTLSGGQMLTLNPGTLTTDAGSSLQVGPVMAIPGDTRLTIQGDFQQNGTLILDQGEVDIRGSYFASGPIQGRGTIRIGPRGGSRMFNNTTLAPGGSSDPAGQGARFGVMTIVGDLQHQSSGLFDMEIGGNQPGISQDQVNIIGQLLFGGGPSGGIRIALVDGFVPLLDAEFILITYDQHDAGRFAHIDGLDLGNGFFFVPIFGDHDFRVRYVPAPGAGLGLAGAAALTVIRRRRRAA